MPVPLPSLVLVLALLTGVAAAWPAPSSAEASGARHIIVRADALRQVYEVRISQGLTTTLLFDTPLQPGGVILEESKRFRWAVGEGGDMLSLLSLDGVEPGQRLKLTVRFADGQAPASADFLLVVVEQSQAEPLVEVYRPPRACAPYWLKAEEERARAFQYEMELAQVRTAQRMVPDGLTGMLSSGQMGEEGVLSLLLVPNKLFTQPPEERIRAQRATSYRAQGRVAAELLLKNESAQPWLAKDAELVGSAGVRLKVLRVWQPKPIPPGGNFYRVVVEAEATEAELRGPFLLRLREENGSRTVTLDGVTFP